MTARDPARGFTAPDNFDRVVWSAMANGARKRTAISWEWDAAASCEKPVYRLMKARRTDLVGKVEAVEAQHPQRYMDMHVPCRKCSSCLRRKSQHWRIRMMEELRSADRSWRVTLTLNPHFRALALMAAQGKYGKERLAAMSPERRTAALADACQHWVTRYLKRVRAQSGAALRYISVAEPHKDGTPHWHLLVHEVSEIPVRHAVLSRQWNHGFTSVKLVDDVGLAGAYPAKYLSKYPYSRVRASVGYGQGKMTPSGPLPEATLKERKVDPPQAGAVCESAWPEGLKGKQAGVARPRECEDNAVAVGALAT